MVRVFFDRAITDELTTDISHAVDEWIREGSGVYDDLEALVETKVEEFLKKHGEIAQGNKR